MDWKNQTVLVTGAGGFIGSQLVEALLSEGARVRAFVRYNSRADPGLLRLLPAELSERLEVISGDVRDMQTIYAAVRDCELVYHLGALISIPYSYRHPAEVASVNFMGTLNLLMACRELGTARLVHTSTSEVYGSARRVPIDEEHPLQGQSPYSASKIGADKMAESFYCAYNLPVVTVRPFNTYGPRQSARAVIPTIITQALSGKTIHLGNLDTTRDFTYVSDTVRGFLLAGSVAGVEGGVFNLGTGSEIRIGDIAERIALKVGHQVEIVVEPQRLRPEKSEVLRLISDNRLARDKLGWEPLIGLDEGLDKTIAWMRLHMDLYRPGQYEL
ncbi:MAG: SDR family NAD(P)-dependent oxidoreductase [Anaerolineaceae bacterium]|nr:MAG: SDR family NAD(P)-dependent oxidoreductase [Anaerolineaceae bacterium]